MLIPSSAPLRTLSTLALGIALATAVGACGPVPEETGAVTDEPAAATDEPAAATDEPVADVALPDYRIADVEDLSLGNVQRYSYHVVVEDEATHDQLVAIIRDVLEIAKGDTPFNALAVGLYDYEEYVGHGYVLGKGDMAPGGDWASADTVSTGAYDRMSLVSEIYTKDWSTRLTPQEVEIWAAWHEEYDVREAEIDPASMEMVDEDALDQYIAQQFGIDANAVTDVMLKQITWMFAR